MTTQRLIVSTLTQDYKSWCHQDTRRTRWLIRMLRSHVEGDPGLTHYLTLSLGGSIIPEDNRLFQSNMPGLEECSPPPLQEDTSSLLEFADKLGIYVMILNDPDWLELI